MKVVIGGTEIDLMSSQDAAEHFRRLQEAAELAHGVPRHFSASGATVAGGTLVLPNTDAASPIQVPAGFQWDVRYLGAANGQGATTALAGAVTFFAGSKMPRAAAEAQEAFYYRDHTPSIPWPALYDRQHVFTGGTYLWFVATNLPANSSLVINGLAIETPIPRTQR